MLHIWDQPVLSMAVKITSFSKLMDTPLPNKMETIYIVIDKWFTQFLAWTSPDALILMVPWIQSFNRINSLLSLSLSVYVSLSLSVCLSVCLSVSLSLSLPLSLLLLRELLVVLSENCILQIIFDLLTTRKRFLHLLYETTNESPVLLTVIRNENNNTRSGSSKCFQLVQFMQQHKHTLTKWTPKKQTTPNLDNHDTSLNQYH